MFFNISTLGCFSIVFFEFPITSHLLPSYSFDLFLFELITSLVVRMSLYQNTIYMAIYLNVHINYLRNINYDYGISFDYHDNLLKTMKNLKLKNLS